MRVACSQDRSDLAKVIRAADKLGITEYDFFHLAFRRWTGREPDTRVLENTYVEYMFRQTVPHWVRHLEREVKARASEGRLNPVEFGAMKFRNRQSPPRHGRLYVGAMATAMVLYTIALMEISYDPGNSQPMPCYGGPGFKVFSEMAYSISGKKPPICRNRKDR
jgi:Arc/MetJ family transcription regulator